MKSFIEFLPLLIFFATYRLSGIFSATLALVISSFFALVFLYLLERKIEKMQWISFLGVLAFGGFTLAFQNESILKFKAPVINALFALVFLLSPFFKGKYLVKSMMGNFFTLEDSIWRRLNYSWVAFFTLCSVSNLYVAFVFPSIWVEFKVFGSLALTLLFLLFQLYTLSPYLKKDLQP